MIQKIEKVAINMRFVFLVLFILASVVAVICYADEEDKKNDVVLELWPADMVPHPPHFPAPKPPEGPARVR